jgi:hypothetical protein
MQILVAIVPRIPTDRRAAESALRNVADMHPGRPVANIKIKNDACWSFDGMYDELWEEDEGRSSSST